MLLFVIELLLFVFRGVPLIRFPSFWNRRPSLVSWVAFAQGVSEKLGTLIEGESLFNDGSAIVVFEVFLGE